MAGKRQTVEARYNHLYKDISAPSSVCFYCGMHSTEKDHVPALDTVDRMGELHFVGYRFVLIPSCRECNAVLGGKPLATVKLRAAVLMGTYAEKYSHILLLPQWQTDIDELEGNLRDYVTQSQGLKLITERRLDYLGRIDERLFYVNAVEPYATDYDDEPVVLSGKSAGVRNTLHLKREAMTLSYIKEQAAAERAKKRFATGIKARELPFKSSAGDAPIESVKVEVTYKQLSGDDINSIGDDVAHKLKQNTLIEAYLAAAAAAAAAAAKAAAA